MIIYLRINKDLQQNECLQRNYLNQDRHQYNSHHKKLLLIKNFNSKQTIDKTSNIISTIKAGNNSYKLKNEIKKLLHLLYQHNKISKKADNNLIKSL